MSEYFYFYVFSIYYLLFIGVVSVLNYCKDWNEKIYINNYLIDNMYYSNRFLFVNGLDFLEKEFVNL